MAIGVLLGGFLEAAIQLPFVVKHGHAFFFTGPDLVRGLVRAMKNPGTRKVLKLIGPTIVGMAAYQLNDLVSTALAGNAGPGLVSSLQYSLRLQELFLGIFAVSIGTVLLPDLTEYAKTGNWSSYNERLVSAMDIIALITVPVTFFSLAQGQHLIRLLFQNRTFNEESVTLTLNAFRFHMPGLLFIALNRILAPAFYAQSDSKSPTLAGIISFAVNIGMASALVIPLKGAGIALSLTIASTVNTALLLFFLRKNPKIDVGRALKSSALYTLKLMLFSGIALIPLLFLNPLLSGFFAGNGKLIAHGLPLVINALFYGAAGIVLLVITKDKQIRALVRIVRNK
jgi:putative peptidoglycan lipid II flippase